MTIADKLKTIAKNESLVYETGKKSEYDRFWDAFQDNGNREQYNYAFFHWKLSKLLFPKYDLFPTSTIAMFQYCNLENFDLVKHIEENNIKLDFSKAKTINYTFDNCKITHVPEFSAISANTLSYVFANNPALTTIDKLILKADGTQTFNKNFYGDTSLANIVIEGAIGQNGFDVSPCPLTHDSLMSILNALMVKTEVKKYTDHLSFVSQEMMQTGRYTITDVSNEGGDNYMIGAHIVGTNKYPCFYYHEEMNYGKNYISALKVGNYIDIVGEWKEDEYGNGWFEATSFTLNELAHTLILGSTNLKKLTNEEKAIATEKGWSLA